MRSCNDLPWSALGSHLVWNSLQRSTLVGSGQGFYMDFLEVVWKGLELSSMVHYKSGRALDAMGCWIDPSWWTHDWCNKGPGMCYPVCGMMHIKEPLLLIRKNSLCGGSKFPFSLSEWSLFICLTPYNRK